MTLRHKQFGLSLLMGLALCLPGPLSGTDVGQGPPYLLGIAQAPSVQRAVKPPVSVSDAPLISMGRHFPQMDTASLVGEVLSADLGLPHLDAAANASNGRTSWRHRLRRRLRSIGAEMATPQSVARVWGTDLSATGEQLQDRALRAAIDTGLDGLNGLQGSFLRRLNINYRTPIGDRDGLLGVAALVSLLDAERHTVFGQTELLWDGGQTGVNTGVGYRMRPVEGLLLGVNAFYDYLSDPSVSRYSVGVEAKSSFLDAYGNWYQGLGEDGDYYSPDGWDVGLTGRLPWLPWLEVGGSYYKWDRNGVEDLEGSKIYVKLRPVPLVSLEVEREDPENGEADLEQGERGDGGLHLVGQRRDGG